MPSVVVDSLEPTIAFKLVGMLVGLAIYNDTILDLHFPTAVYRKLQGQQVDLEDLKVFNPMVGQSLQKLLDYKGEFLPSFALSPLCELWVPSFHDALFSLLAVVCPLY